MRVVSPRPRKARFLAPICLLAGALFCSTSAGCSSASATFCNDKCDCEGNCSTNARETCINTGENDEKTAHDVGCGSQADAFTSCENSRSQCIGGQYNTGGCDPESTKLVQCLLSAQCAFGLDGLIHCI